MKRIILFIIGLIVIIGALTFFTYSVDTKAQEAPTVAQGAANQSGTPDTQSTTAPVTSETGTVATPAVENAAPREVQATEPVEIPVPKAPASRNPSNPGSEQAAQYAKMNDHTAVEAPHAAEIAEPANPQAEHKTSQSFDESLGIAHDEPAMEPKPTETPSEQAEIPEEIKPSKSAGVPSCIVLCDKVCNTLKDETENLIEE